jgi:hypothetical protein
LTGSQWRSSDALQKQGGHAGVNALLTYMGGQEILYGEARALWAGRVDPGWRRPCGQASTSQGEDLVTPFDIADGYMANGGLTQLPQAHGLMFEGVEDGRRQANGLAKGVSVVGSLSKPAHGIPPQRNLAL